MPNATNTTMSLPVDILRMALPYTTLKSRLQLADTCRYWRGFLLNEWEDMWDTIVIKVTRDNKDNISNADLNRVLLHAPRDKIRHLSFRSSDNNNYTTAGDNTTLGYKDIGSIIVKHGCRQIETIVYDVQKKDTIEGWFGDLVMMNKETLKRLWLRGNLSASIAKAWLSTLLITCSELQELCCMATHLSPSPPPPPGAPIEIGLLVQLPPRLPLTRLALSTVELTSALPAIISQCPHLEELVFDERYSPTLSSGGFGFLTNDILEQVDQHCPNIKHISINTTACMDDPFEYDNMSRAGPGLQVLKCMMIPPAGYSGTLQMLIDTHYTTLDKLILRIGKPDRIMDIQPIPPFVIPGSCQQLRYLTLHDSPHRMMQSYTSRQLCDLLLSCPCLDSLSLKSHALYTTDVYATLADMTTTSTSLRHLYLECPTSISVTERDDYQHVSQSISDLFKTQGATRLKTIELHLGGLMNDRILESVGNGCTSLSQFVIGRSNALTVAGMIAWAQHTQQTRLTHASFYLYDDQSVMNSSENLLLITMALSLLPQLIHLNLAHPTVTYKEAKEHLLRFCILSRSKWRPKITYAGFNPTTGPFTAQFRLQAKVEKRSCDSARSEWTEYSCQEWWDKSPNPMPITVHYDHQKHRVHMGNKY